MAKKPKAESKEIVPATPKKLGRPSLYSDELALKICEMIANGESMRHITMLEGMPDKRTILRWLDEKVDFRTHYAHARERQADHFLEEIRDIANDGRNDWERIESERTGQDRIVLNAEAVQRSRLRVDTLKWVMSKLAPKKYGDKIEHEVSVTNYKVTLGGDY
jgi:hypothetical protein